MIPGTALPPATRGIVLMVTSIGVLSIMDVLAKDLMTRVPIYQVVWGRYAMQALVVAIFLLPKFPGVLKTAHPGMQALRSVLMFAASLFFFAGFALLGLAEAAAIFIINPLLITLGAMLFLGERVGPRRLIGVAFGFIGALIIIRPGTEVFTIYALLPLIGAALFAGYALTTRFLSHDESLWTSLLYTPLMGMVIGAVAIPFLWEPMSAVDLGQLFLIGLVAAVAQLMMIRAFTLAQASTLAPLGYSTALFAAINGVLWFDERLDPWTVFGALVIVGAGLYVWHREWQLSRRARRG